MTSINLREKDIRLSRCTKRFIFIKYILKEYFLKQVFSKFDQSNSQFCHLGTGYWVHWFQMINFLLISMLFIDDNYLYIYYLWL